MTSATATSTAEEGLARYGAVVADELRRWLPDGEPAVHLYDLVRDYPSRPGKGLRPTLLLATCEAFGGEIADALRPAVAIELLHNAFLVHDDVEDASTRRRGGPTLHELHGIPLAVNAGDALALGALAPLREPWATSGRLQRLVLDELERTARITVEGQAIELGWRRDNTCDLEPEDYLELILRKTCWYTTIGPLRIGAMLGARHDVPLAAINRFGFFLGAAFQIRDDLLSLLASDDAFGKAPLEDLIEGKRTLMLIHLLGAVDGPDRAWLAEHLGRPLAERTADDAVRVLELMQEHGSIRFAEEYGAGIGDAAWGAFETAFAGLAPSPGRDVVAALVPYMLSRDR